MSQIDDQNDRFRQSVTKQSENGTVTAPYVAADLHRLIVPIDSLRPMPGNARMHDERNLSAIADSLLAHGQQTPLVALAKFREVERVILKGHGTWMAAKRLLHWPHIAVAWFIGSDTEAAAYSVRDNRTSDTSRFNAPALVALSADANLDLLTLGWNEVELADLLGAQAPAPKFTPEAPAHRLDELAHDTTCPACGHTWHQGQR